MGNARRRRNPKALSTATVIAMGRRNRSEEYSPKVNIRVAAVTQEIANEMETNQVTLLTLELGALVDGFCERHH